MTITHRMSKSPTYKSWMKMRERCGNPNAVQYPWYGGRGIEVCARWTLFENFFADMGVRPAGTTLDRIDNACGYEPGNCRWLPAKSQQRNQLSTIRIDGCALRDICEDRGLNFNASYRRYRRGLDVSKVLQDGHLRKRVSDQAISEMCRLRRDGLSNKEVAYRLGMSVSGLEKWIRKALKNGLIERVGHAKAKSSNLSPKPLWQSAA